MILIRLIVFLLLLTFIPSVFAQGQSLRYRGQYTLGHEVNSFCPAINSQCYWLSPDTEQQARQQLKQLVDDSLFQEKSAKPYESICIVVEGKINRDPAMKNSIGFAAGYDGLFTVNKVFDLCNNTTIVTQGDLQHHRWVLEQINLNSIDIDLLGKNIIDLDFGENMTVSGHSGCHKFSGRAVLNGAYFIIEDIVINDLHSAATPCSAEQNEIEFQLWQILDSEITISIEDKKYLLLNNDNTGKTLLRYRLRDWVY